MRIKNFMFIKKNKNEKNRLGSPDIHHTKNVDEPCTNTYEEEVYGIPEGEEYMRFPERASVDLLVNYAFIAYQDDRLSLIHSFAGEVDGVRKLVHQVVLRSKCREDVEEEVYAKLMKILDGIVIDRDSATSKKYIEMYNSSISRRYRSFWS